MRIPNILTIIGIFVGGLCASALVGSQVPKQTVRGYPMLDPNRVYRPGEQVRVDEPHGAITGLMSMDASYFVRPLNVKVIEQNAIGSKGTLVADVRHATSAVSEQRAFSYACDALKPTVGEVEVARMGAADEMIIGRSNAVCSLKPIGNGVRGTEANVTSPAQAESSAVAQLRTINTAEVVFLASNGGKYGTIPEIISAGLLDRRFAGQVGGYTFEVHLQQEGTNYLAIAMLVGKAGRYSFISTSDAVVRYGAGPAGTPVGQPVP